MSVIQKSTFKIVLGILFIIFGWMWVALRWFDEGKTLDWFDWTYCIVFCVNGIFHLMQGLGKNVELKFSKKKINKTQTSISGYTPE